MRNTNGSVNEPDHLYPHPDVDAAEQAASRRQYRRDWFLICASFTASGSGAVNTLYRDGSPLVTTVLALIGLALILFVTPSVLRSR